MITTRLMLDSLRSWVLAHRGSLEQYVDRYPYSPYQTIDATNLLRHKVEETIHHIITLIAPHHHQALTKTTENTNCLLSHQQINALCKVKTLLDDLKIGFLTVASIKGIKTSAILETLDSTIIMTLKSSQNITNNAEDFRPRNRSFEAVGERQRQKSDFMKRYEHEINRKPDNRERSDRIKSELYRQMEEDLERKGQEIKQRKKQRMIAEYRSILGHNIAPRCDFQRKVKDHKYQVEQKKDFQRPRGSQQRRLFKYLDDDLEEKRKRREQEEKNEFLFDTPKRQRFSTLPSTGERSSSISRRKPQEAEDSDLPSYDFDNQRLDELKRELDERLRLSKIQYTEPEEMNESLGQNMWEQFERESTDNEHQNRVEVNLDDSLELMKQEEELNKTGEFNIVPLTNIENHQYSFSND